MFETKDLPTNQNKEQLGLYVHIPFCKQACSYCNFYFSTSLKSVDPLIEAICHEISLKQNFWPQQILSTLYFGGGSPSILQPRQLDSIFLALHKHFNLNHLTECTIECNPDDITKENLSVWKNLGFNRLSIGIQSTNDQELTQINRAHSAKEAINAIELALELGFDNLTVDFIYGIAGQTETTLAQSLEILSKYQINHFSAYALTVEPKTALANQVKKKKVQIPSDEIYYQFFNQIKNTAKTLGFEHYEISNFAKSGFEAVHNSNYWKGQPYIGIGPSAHSFNYQSRFWNLSNNNLYIKAMVKNEKFWEEENLSQVDKYNEYIITLIRTKWGLSLDEISTRFEIFKAHFAKVIAEMVRQKLMYEENNIFRLTAEGQFLCDHISTQLMVDTE